MASRELSVCTLATYVRRWWQDTPELEALLSSSPWDRLVEAEFGSGTRDYFAQMSRQDAHIERVLPRAREAGLEYLLHIDDDELLYCAAGVTGLYDALERAPLRAADLHMQNLEALVPKLDGTADPFREVSAFRHRPGEFCAYANGKALGRLSASALRPAGPHHFADGLASAGSAEAGTHELPPSVAVVLHFESVTYGAWALKYTDLARTHAGESGTARVRDRAPSLFYVESMEAMGAIASARASGDAAALCIAEADARAVYCKWKMASEPLPPPSSRPRTLERLGYTIIDVFAQPRVASVSAAIGTGTSTGTSIATCAGVRGAQVGSTPHAWSARPSHLAAGGPSVSARDMSSLVAATRAWLITASCDEAEEVRRLETLLDAAGVSVAHAAALRAAGATAGAMVRASKTEAEELAKRAGLPLGLRLKLRVTIGAARGAVEAPDSL